MRPNRKGNSNRGHAHNRFKHGLTGTPTYKSWSGMKARCYKETSDDYKNYGGRGSKVCDEWHDFRRFFQDMGECPPGLSIERVNNDGDYTLENCRWATKLDQGRNRRFVKLTLEIAEAIRADRANGRTLEWLSDHYGISQSHALRVVNREVWA